MKTQTLKRRLLSSFILVILILAGCVAVLGFYLIKNQIIERAQREMDHKLNAARFFYDNQITVMAKAFSLFSPVAGDRDALKEQFGLDYLDVVDADTCGTLPSGIVRAACLGQPQGGTRIITVDELRLLGDAFVQKARIQIVPTAQARVSSRQVLDSAMAVEYAQPLKDERGMVVSVLYGGKIINRDFKLVDEIRSLIFDNALYDSKPVGTVTIFQDDVRITTNVLNREGERALGTRVSEMVYSNVVEKARPWKDRAFVVTDWYLTGYEPIRDQSGAIIGILYVGLLEKPFLDMQRNTFLVLLGIIVAAGMIAVFFSLMLADAITRPLRQALVAADRIGDGDLQYHLKVEAPVTELHEFVRAFNQMVDELHERDERIMETQKKLADLNKSYLDLIGFVAHELKGILSSVILNAYAVRDGLLGMVNFKQRKAMDLVTRNLDHLVATVKNFLNLSRIEKGEMSLQINSLLLKEDIFDVSIEEFSKPASEKELRITNEISEGLRLQADSDLLLIAANNLITNAIKYSVTGGLILVSARVARQKLQVSVYNDGIPLSPDECAKLFRKFSRLSARGDKKVQGTGLGLFITSQIIERHGGRIWVEPQETGTTFRFEIPITQHVKGDTSDNTA